MPHPRLSLSKCNDNKKPLSTAINSEVIDKLSGARYFTKFDVRWGYENICIKEGDEWKAAFITNRGLFKPCIMFFGLTNLPATFQSMMNNLFQDLITRGVVIVYMDNILIFTKDKVEVVRGWLVPKDKHKLQQFLGFANYYQQFINLFTNIAWPLHKLTGNCPWIWTC